MVDDSRTDRYIEVLVTAVLLAVLTAGLPLLFPDGHLLFSKPLWLDEYHTRFLAAEPSLHQLWVHLSRGADFNPPFLYLLLRPFALTGDALAAVELRVFSFSTVLLALNLLYWTLRKDFSKLPSLIGTLAVSAHPLVIQQAFNGRFYGPLLLFASLLGFLLTRADSWSIKLKVLAGVAAVGLCTIHYFGILALALLVLGYWVLSQPYPKRITTLGALAAGPVTLLCCVPLYLGQRASLSIPTWLPEPSLSQVMQFLSGYLTWPPLIGGVLLLGLRQVLPGRTPLPEKTPAEDRAPLRSGPLLLLAGLPLLLIVFSFLVQSVLLDRYAIVVILALGPFMAMVFSRERLPMQAMGLLLLVLLGGWGFGREAMQATGYSAALSRLRDQVETLSSSETVVVPNRGFLYSLAAPGSKETTDAELLFPVGGTEDAADGFRRLGASGSQVRLFQIETEVGRIHSELFGFPPLVSLADLRTRETFLILDPGDTYPSLDHYLSTFFPRFSQTELEGMEVRIVRLHRGD